jgi:exodeoxyribonuclease III
MPKRTIEDVENENHNSSKAVAGSGKPAKVVNLAYGEANKEGIPIPCLDIDRPKISISAGHQAFIVCAWNLKGLRAILAKRSKELKKLWESEQLDILGITEHKITEVEKTVEIEEEIRKLIKDDIYFVWNMCSIKKGYSGSLVIVKKSLFDKCKSAKYGIGNTDPEGRVITLDFEHVAVVLAYVPNSGQTLDRLNYRITTWDKEFSEYVCEIAKLKMNGVILCGDLNVAIRDMDIGNVDAPHVPKGAGTTPQERNSFQKLFLNKGFIDTFAHMHPDKTGWFTYWSIRAGNKPKNRGLRLDYVLASKTKILDAYIAKNGYAMDGDHCPVGVVAEIDKL